MATPFTNNWRWQFVAIALIALQNFASSSTQASPPPSTWTTGHKKILVIPVRFTDASGPTNSDIYGLTGWNNLTNGSMPVEINNFFLKQSYGQLSVDFTILPVISLGVSTNYYTSNLVGTPYAKWTAWGDSGSLADDARAKARAVGLTNGQAALYESANYDLDVIALGYVPGQAGAASDGGRTVIAFDYFNALPHEIGHCLGLQHANGYSRATFNSPVKSGTYFFNAYGDVYDLMGWKEFTHTATPAADHDVNTYFKYELGWLTASNILTLTNSGLYRVHAFDQGSIDAGKNYALRIARDASYYYWLDFRQAITNLPDTKWSQGGLEVHFGADSQRASSGATILWDMTPGSRGPTNATFATMHDAQLQIGRTYSDNEANIHITPIKKGGTTPESLDVQVNFGPFPGNQAPTLSLSPTTLTLGAGVGQTFTATATDPDGDTLAYYWEFDDNQTLGGTDFGGVNSDARFATNGFHAWTQNGINYVRCTVSDMKGHSKTLSAAVTITNGLTAPATLSGTVKDELGNPLAGAIVNNYLSGVAYGSAGFAGSSVTAADGKYLIAVPATNVFYKLTAMWQGYTFTNSSGFVISTNYVGAGGLTGVNFTRVRTTRSISGGVYVAGRGYDSPTDGTLIISNGSQSVIVSNGGWQMNVADGSFVTLTATATNPAYTVTSDFPKPYTVVDDVLSLSFFVDVPGAMPLTGFTSSGTNSDDTVGTFNIPVVMTLPAGMTNWPSPQSFPYTIDDSSTAEYGLDYKMHGGIINFYGGFTPVPFNIPLTIYHTGVPKNKTVVIKLIPGNSVANLGPISTFTYTISNPPPAVSAVSVTNGVFNLTWPAVSTAHYTIESTPTLNPPAWISRAPHTNLTGFNGTMTRSISLGGATNEFFRVRVE
jgi:hypothetical protein